jgi:hypothetical protein
MKDEALKLALEQLEECADLLKMFEAPIDSCVGATMLQAEEAITAIKQALSDATHLAAPVQQSRSDVEPVAQAWVDWLPEGTTHIAKCKATTNSGGRLSLRTHVFKYDGDVLKVYTTDNDNEYPGWRVAKDVFYHLNFPIIPLYATPPAAQPESVNLDTASGFTFSDGTGTFIGDVQMLRWLIRHHSGDYWAHMAKLNEVKT